MEIWRRSEGFGVLKGVVFKECKEKSFPEHVRKAYRRNGGTDPLILNLAIGEVHDPAALLKEELPVSFEWKSGECWRVLEY